MGRAGAWDSTGHRSTVVSTATSIHTSERTIITPLRGRALLGDPSLNKGTAFTDEERGLLGLHGLLPARVESLAEQCDATRARYDDLSDDLERHVFLRGLEDTNEVLFYAFLDRHLEELLPIVYTPTVGDACRRFSHIYRRPHGLFLSYEHRALLPQQLANVPGPIDVVVVTDGERVLGLGDQGVGGMGIPIGKLALYTAVGRLNPRRTLPVLLDVGTNNPELLEDPRYLGAAHPRLDGDAYLDFVDAFVTGVRQRFPGAVVQWEDFGGHHARLLLDRHRDAVPSFNDDIQGTAAVALATLRAAGRAAGARLADQRICIVGAGAAGCGIAAVISSALRRDGVDPTDGRLVLVDEHGLVRPERTDLTADQAPLAVSPSILPGDLDAAGARMLDQVVAAAGCTTILGVSGQGGLFGPSVMRALTPMASGRVLVLPLSNPTDNAEITPVDAIDWTEGRAIVATGSPFPAVAWGGERREISQANNVYVFPGLGLGAVASQARRVTDTMVMAAADRLTELSPASPTAGVLPRLSDAPAVSRSIAQAVAMAAIADGVSPMAPDAVDAAIDAGVFRSQYARILPGDSGFQEFVSG